MILMARTISIRLVSILVVVIGTLINQHALAVSPGSHAVYIGDLNNDGIDDVYLKANTVVVAMPVGRIFAVPLPSQGENSYVVYSQGGTPPTFANPVVNNSINVASLTRVHNVPHPDYNNDGAQDFVVTSTGSAPIAVVITGGASPASLALLDGGTDPNDDPMDGDFYNGTIPGEFRVAKDGSANYSIPIDVPPGINDAQPNVNLNYNSNRGNGVVGWGWAIGGQSKIHRCRATLIRDNYVDGVNDDHDYKWCMDGKRLVQIGSNNFRTENDPFSKIQQLNKITLANGKVVPRRWIVKLRDGSVQIYGTTNSWGATRYTSESNQPYEYHIYEDRDPAGNYSAYRYQYDRAAGTHRLQHIYYTRNRKAQNINQRVSFIYGNRNDQITRYFAGSKQVEDKRLTQIQLRSNNALIHRYLLSYQNPGSTYYGKKFEDPLKTARLWQLRHCFGSSTANSSCSERTRFDWSKTQNDIAQITGTDANSNPIPTNKSYFYSNLFETLDPSAANAGHDITIAQSPYTNIAYFKGDLKPSVFGLNNDSIYWVDEGSTQRQELTGVLAGSWQDCVSFNSSGSQTQCATKEWEESTQIVLDLNGDDREDIMLISPGARLQGAKAFLRTGNGLVESTGSGSYALTATDALSYEVSYTHLSGTYTNRVLYRLSFNDFNGDGLVDIMRYPALTPATITVHTGAKYDVSVALNTGTGFSNFSEWLNIANDLDFLNLASVGDVNGDGQPDLVALNGKVALNSNGQTLLVDDNWRFGTAGHHGNQFTLREYPPTIADVNGDGYGDYVSISALGQNQTRVYLSTGEGFEQTFDFSPTYSHSNSSNPNEKLWYALTDINGDGNLDIMAMHYSTVLGLDFQDIATRMYDQLGMMYPIVDVYFGDGQGQFVELTRDYFNVDTNFPLSWIKANPVSNEIVEIRAPNSHRISIDYAPLDPFDRRSFYEPAYENTPVYSQLPLETLAGAGGDIELAYANQKSGAIQLNGGFTTDSFRSSSFGRKHASRRAVSAYTTDTGNGEKRAISKTYENALLHKTGYGPLGFQFVRTSEAIGANESRVTSSKYSQEATPRYNLAGRLLEEENRVSSLDTGNNALVSERKIEWKVRYYENDRDTSGGNHNSPLFVAFPLSEHSKVYEPNDGSLLYSDVNYTQSASNVSACDEPSSFDTKLVRWNAGTANNEIDSFGTPLVTGNNRCDVYGLTGSYTTNTTRLNLTTSGKWILGLVENQDKTYLFTDSDGSPTVTETREIDFSYFPANGNISLGQIPGYVETEIREPNSADPTTQLTTTYGYNAYGTQTSKLESWPDVAANDSLAFNSRTMTATETYTFPGVRTVVTTEPLVGSTTDVYNPHYGNLVSSTDINGLLTTHSYDSVGRLNTSNYSDGTQTSYDYRKCSGCFEPNSNAFYYEHSKTTGQTGVRSFYDVVNRAVGARTQGLTGDYLYNGTTYDRDGRIASRSANHKAPSQRASRTTEFEYDIMGRLRQTDFADGSSQTRDYSVLFGAALLTETDSLNKVRSVATDGRGRANVVTDHLLTPIEYHYTPQGDLRDVVVDSAGAAIETRVEYDVLRRKTALIDPDLGRVEYTYNSLDLQHDQTDAENQVTRFAYDQLGRQISRTDDATGTALTHTWSYDTAANGVGLLASVIGFDTEARAFEETYTYNDQSLLTTTATTINGQPFGSTIFYDNLYREIGRSFPNTAYTLGMNYNAFGQVDQYLNMATQDVLWEANSEDTLGNISDVTLGNNVNTLTSFVPETGLVNTIRAVNGNFVVQDHSYDFDTEGNLVQRRDIERNLTQNFCYDDLHRLTGMRTGGSCANDNDFTYDNLGNLTAKQGTPGTFNYGDANNARPHAVTSITNGANTISYGYNNNGEMISGNGRTIDYTTFGKPTTISANGNTVTFVYGPDKNRIQRIESANNEITTYHDNYEYIVRGSNVEQRHYLADFGIYTVNSGASNEAFYTYLHRDHLGSIVAQTGEQADANDFIHMPSGAWGERQDWNEQAVDVATATLITDRAFTNHEHVDSVGLIHMNGRAYDPELGRFVSPDPKLAFPLITGSFNRYSYVLNNPLKYIDPTGESPTLVCSTIFGITGSPELGHLVRNVVQFSCTSVAAVPIAASAVAAGLVAVIAPANFNQDGCSSGDLCGEFELHESITPLGGVLAEGTKGTEADNDKRGDGESAAEKAASSLSGQATPPNNDDPDDENGGNDGEIQAGVNRRGEPQIKIQRPDGSVKIISRDRVKIRKLEPRAKNGTGLVKFKDPIRGTKGKKRLPTKSELELLKKFTN